MHSNICCVCDTETHTDEPFWSLHLPLVNSDNGVYSVVKWSSKFKTKVSELFHEMDTTQCTGNSD